MKLSYVLITILVFICLSSNSIAGGNVECRDDWQGLECIKNDFTGMYKNEYKKMWRILRSAEKKVLMCNDIDLTSTFLSLASIRKNNVEFLEYLNEVFEKLLFKDSKCFIDATVNLTDSEVQQVVFVIRNPIYHEKARVVEIINSLENNLHTNKIKEYYFIKSSN